MNRTKRVTRRLPTIAVPKQTPPRRIKPALPAAVPRVKPQKKPTPTKGIRVTTTIIQELACKRAAAVLYAEIYDCRDNVATPLADVFADADQLRSFTDVLKRILGDDELANQPERNNH